MAGMKMLYHSLGVQTTLQTMEEDILKFSPTVMFRGKPISSDLPFR